MPDFRDFANDPKHRKAFEKLLRLAAQRGDDDLVAERLSWGVDPDGQSKRGRTALICNCRGSCPSAATVRVLLKGGADPTITDAAGLTALDYARRKLARLNARPRTPPVKSPSLDENGQLQLGPEEQAEYDQMRDEVKDPAFMAMWWKERLRAARRVFNDPDQVEQIVALLESATPQ